MIIPHKKIFIIANIFLLTIFGIYMGFKIISNLPVSNNQFSLTALIVFIFVGLGLIYTTIHSKDNSFIITIFMPIIFILGILFSFDCILPEIWNDARGDIITSTKVTDYGIRTFMDEYHTQSLDTINKDSLKSNRYFSYSHSLPLFSSYYQRKLIENKGDFISIDYNRTEHHPPIWFIITGLWQKSVGSSLISLKILMKIIALVYLLSLFVLLKSYNKDRGLIISIISLVAMTPMFLYSTEIPKNDLLLGIAITWLIYFLHRNTKNDRKIIDFLAGFTFSLVILSKFTGILLIIPIIAYYIMEFKQHFFKKFLLFGISGLILPLLLYWIYDYDILLNIITGRSHQDADVVKAWGSKIWYIKNTLLYGLYKVGIPIVLLLLSGLFSSFNNLKIFSKESILFCGFYFMIFLLLWGSAVDRHQIGFVALYAPFLLLFVSNFKNKAFYVTSSLSLLFMYNIIFIFNKYITTH